MKKFLLEAIAVLTIALVLVTTTTMVFENVDIVHAESDAGDA